MCLLNYFYTQADGWTKRFIQACGINNPLVVLIDLNIERHRFIWMQNFNSLYCPSGLIMNNAPEHIRLVYIKYFLYLLAVIIILFWNYMVSLKCWSFINLFCNNIHIFVNLKSFIDTLRLSMMVNIRKKSHKPSIISHSTHRKL